MPVVSGGLYRGGACIYICNLHWRLKEKMVVGIPPPLDPFVGAGALVHRPYGVCRLFQRETGRERAES